MSFFSILETLLIGPLKLVFEIIFEYANIFTGHPGLAIIFLSLVMNILVLPLYRRADAMQEKARDTEMKLHDGVSHIKKTFSGDEKMMILQTYYRQNNYKPTDALHGSVSLLLEIPFFMAAYQFLSHLDILKGVSFGPIKDLGAPDGLIVIGGIAINLLPILMTLINVISSALYLKGFPLKTKIQLYAMALFFLVFLYTSPSCLVFYWTLNNVFSLVKTIFYKLKNPQKVLKFLTSAVGLFFLVYGGFIYNTDSVKRKIFLIGIGVLLQLPLILPLLRKHIVKDKKSKEVKPNRKLFILGAVFLTVLVGLLIPSTFIAASPQEYVDISYFHNPLWYIVSSLSLSAGTFIIWMGVFYWLATPKGKVIFDRLVWILSGLMLVNYMFFGTNLGVISSALQYENGLSFTIIEKLINILVILAVMAVMLVCIIKWKRITATVLVTATVAIAGMSAVNVVTINNSINSIVQSDDTDELPNFNLSKKGKNVVVIMLDRAIGAYVPYMFNEKPELKEKFDGFTYYSNVISFGGNTNHGTPPLLGGYEYTPIEMNKRDTEALVEKHNEALKVMPLIFSQNNFDVTVCDPVYANYQWIPDLSVYDEYPEIKAYITKGKFGDVDQKKALIENNYRNFFCFGIMKSMPLFLQTTIYNNGEYNQVKSETEDAPWSTQTAENISSATGLLASFMESYNVMSSMSNMTKITDDDKGTFLFLSNDMTHEAMLLQEPEYVPAQKVDNTEYDSKHAGRFELNGKKLNMDDVTQMSHYHINMAAMIKLGEWFDYMREKGVYDNTRIILVADHGRALKNFDELIMDDGSLTLYDAEFYNPLLMVKDFDSKGFVSSDEFMTNADVPTIAVKDIIDDPRNPFTGKPINSDEKTAHDQFVIMSYHWDVKVNNGNTFMPAWWARVKDNIWDKKNWTFYDTPMALNEYDVKPN